MHPALPSPDRPSPPNGGIVLGVTATRTGLTPEQAAVVLHLLAHATVRELHHGDVYFSSRVAYNPSTP